jgi:hypothetical protein
VSRARRVRWWYQRELAWWRRRAGWVGEQAPGLWDGEWDHAWVGGRELIWPGWWRRLAVGAAAQQCGGDGADGQGGHDQDGMAGERVIEADLGLVQAEAVLAELEAFFHRPARDTTAGRGCDQLPAPNTVTQ